MEGSCRRTRSSRRTRRQRRGAGALLALLSKLLGASLEVDDCVLRAPFDGEIAQRTTDPGAFVRPGASIVTSSIARSVRLTGDVPEVDFAAVSPGTPSAIPLVATKRGPATDRAPLPAADPATRTVHFEVDVPDPGGPSPSGRLPRSSSTSGEPVTPSASRSRRDRSGLQGHLRRRGRRRQERPHRGARRVGRSVSRPDAQGRYDRWSPRGAQSSRMATR